MDNNIKQRLRDSNILTNMKIIRKFDSLGQKLRQQKGIKLKQPLLDYAFGFTNKSKRVFLFEHEREVLGEALNMYDLGYNRGDVNFYSAHLFDIDEIKNKEHWEVLEEDGLWIGLYFLIPPWLKKICEDRDKKRQEIMKRKKEELNNN